jgi:hypothetical protein
MAFNFVKFTETDASFAARVTIRQTGQFGFNIGSVNLYNIREYKFAVLYYDKSQHVVGIQLTKETCDGAIELVLAPNNCFVKAKNFCEKFQIDYSSPRRFRLKREEQSGILYFELDRPLEGRAVDGPSDDSENED